MTSDELRPFFIELVSKTPNGLLGVFGRAWWGAVWAYGWPSEGPWMHALRLKEFTGLSNLPSHVYVLSLKRWQSIITFPLVSE